MLPYALHRWYVGEGLSPLAIDSGTSRACKSLKQPVHCSETRKAEICHFLPSTRDPESDSSHVFRSRLSDPYKLRVFVQPIKSRKHERGNSQHIAFLNQIYRFLQESSIWCRFLFLPNSIALHSRDSFEEIIITFSCLSFTFPRQTLFLAFFSSPVLVILRRLFLYCYYCVLGSLRQPAATLSVRATSCRIF